MGGNATTVAEAAAAAEAGLSYEQRRPGPTGSAAAWLPSFPLHAPAETALNDWLASLRQYRRYLNNHDRLAQLGSFAARRLLLPKEYGTIAGTSRGVSLTLLSSYADFFDDTKLLSPKTSPLTTGSALAAAIGQVYHLQGMTTAISAACSSGLHAVGTAMSLVRTGIMPGALVVAAEACLDPFTIAALSAARVHSQRPGYRPFSAERSGLALGEGSAAITIAPEPPAGVTAPIELLAFASCRETATMTGITAEAEGLQRAMATAIHQAGIAKTDIDLIISHGAGTARGDAAEFAAYHGFFDNVIPPLQHYKWLLGHTLGATGLQALALGLYAWQQGRFHPAPYTLGFDFPQVPTAVPRHLMVCALGFGGICTALILRRHD